METTKNLQAIIDLFSEALDSLTAKVTALQAQVDDLQQDRAAKDVRS